MCVESGTIFPAIFATKYHQILIICGLLTNLYVFYFGRNVPEEFSKIWQHKLSCGKRFRHPNNVILFYYRIQRLNVARPNRIYQGELKRSKGVAISPDSFICTTSFQNESLLAITNDKTCEQKAHSWKKKWKRRVRFTTMTFYGAGLSAVHVTRTRSCQPSSVESS